MSFLPVNAHSRAQYVVAIAGITGNLGRAITPVFLTTFKPYFSAVRGFVRNSSSDAAKALASSGVEIHQVAEDEASVLKALQGVDVLINVLGSSALKLKEVVAEAAVKAGVKVYFLSEFGADHRLNDFPGYAHQEWLVKKELEKKARQFAGDKTKVISFYPGLFLEDSFGPWFGFDTANKTYTVVGSPSQPVTFTSKVDIARSLAELALLALSTSSSTVPDHVRISGTSASYVDVKNIVEKVRKEAGIKDDKAIDIKSEDLEAFKEQTKQKLLANPQIDILGHLKILLAEGKLDFSTDNSNELVNPRGSVWKWKTVEDFIREVGGRPFGA